MRAKTSQAMYDLRAVCAKVPLIARPFAAAVLAVLECFYNELKGVDRGEE